MAAQRTKSNLNFSIAVPRGAQRFRELIVYVSKRSEHDPWFGAIKLNKILYYADFGAFEKFGVPLTGMPYFRLINGPAPKPLLIYRRDLESEGAIRIDKISFPNGKIRHRTIALREPILEHFTSDEVSLVDRIIDDLWSQNGKEVSDASHDIRWKVLNDKDDIPYEFAYLSNEVVTAAEIERTKQLAAENGWMARYGG